jgi:hypothetical protein
MKKYFLILFLLSTHLIHTDGGILVQDGFASAFVPPSEGHTTRLFDIYLPPHYAESTERYPVVYYLPGLGTRLEQLSLAAGNTNILNDIICRNIVVPMIVIHVDSTLFDGINPDTGKWSYLGSWYVNSELNGQWENYMIQELIPYVDANYRTKASVDFRGVSGQSMGGYGAYFLGTKYPEAFSSLMALSGTPFWAYIDTDLAQPGNQTFLVNSFVLPELPPDKSLSPDNGPNTFNFFTYSAALSPNLTEDTQFTTSFSVDMPFFVNGDGTVQTIPGTFYGADPSTGAPLTFTESLILDFSVINRWIEKDPYFLMDSAIDTLSKQTIFFDAGTIDLANNTGARIISDKYASLEIDHEYLLNTVGHADDLVVPILTARDRTVFQMMSAHFATAGATRTRLVGNGSIVLQNGATMTINKGDIVGIETAPDLGVSQTNFTISIGNNSSLIIGTKTVPGGALQIGNSYSKARSLNPPLSNDEVRGSILINGSNALLEVGLQGLLGFGCGTDGQDPNQPNFFSASGLTNVKATLFAIQQGTFRQDQIASGLETDAALLAIGPNASFSFSIDPSKARMYGGGNLIAFPDGWRTHPLIETTPGELLPNGERDIISTNPNAIDPFYKEPIASKYYYFDHRLVGILSSSEQLDDNINPTPFQLLNEASVQNVFNYFDINQYLVEYSKEAAIGTISNNTRIDYLDIATSGSAVIMRVDKANLPIGTNQQIDFGKILKLGAIGVWVETLNGQRTLVRVYDLEPDQTPPTF